MTDLELVEMGIKMLKAERSKLNDQWGKESKRIGKKTKKINDKLDKLLEKRTELNKETSKEDTANER